MLKSELIEKVKQQDYAAISKWLYNDQLTSRKMLLEIVLKYLNVKIDRDELITEVVDAIYELDDIQVLELFYEIKVKNIEVEKRKPKKTKTKKLDEFWNE